VPIISENPQSLRCPACKNACMQLIETDDSIPLDRDIRLGFMCVACRTRSSLSITAQGDQTLTAWEVIDPLDWGTLVTEGA
jgi:C4-type Zn-finger protein